MSNKESEQYKYRKQRNAPRITPKKHEYTHDRISAQHVNTHENAQQQQPVPKQLNEELVSIGENTRQFSTDKICESIDDFENMNFLTQELFRGICDYGFKFPSPIQAKTIHIINNGYDLIAQSQSGSGKTGAFAIGSLSVVDPKISYPQILILANTRLLAMQIEKVIQNISKYMGISNCLCVGGHQNNSFVNAQQVRYSHVIIGTPGRVNDMISKNAFDGKKIKILIMDESDVLLKEDFRDQIAEIISNMGENTQICIFSATFTREALQLTEKFLRNPYRVTVEKENLSVKDVKQYKIDLRYDNNKFYTLQDLFTKLQFNQMIIFVKSIRNAEELRNKLMDDSIQAGLIHGKMNSMDRENILREFRLNYIKILISTDVMCRGIDIDNLHIVINYDLPDDPETYIHRVGRSGRFGGQGIAINFCTYNDEYKIITLNREYRTNIVSLPDIEEINSMITGFKPAENKVQSKNNYL